MEIQKERIEAAGLTLVAISVDPPQKNLALANRLSLSFALLSDEGGMAAQGFDVWDAETEIALAATIVVGKGGKVSLRLIGADKGDRPDVAEILDEL